MRKIELGVFGGLAAAVLGLAGCEANKTPQERIAEDHHYVAVVTDARLPNGDEFTDGMEIRLCGEDLPRGVKLLTYNLAAQPEGTRIVASSAFQYGPQPFQIAVTDRTDESHFVSHVEIFAEPLTNPSISVSGNYHTVLTLWADNQSDPQSEIDLNVSFNPNCSGQGNVNGNSNSAVNENDNVIGNSNFNFNDNGQGNGNDNNGQVNDNQGSVNDNQGGPITCVSDSDCGIEHGGLSCNADGNKVVQIDYLRTCENPGTEDSVCVTSTTTLENVVENCGISGFENQRACNGTTGDIDDVYVTRGCSGGACFASEELRTVQPCTYGCKSDATCKTLEELQGEVTAQITDLNWTPVDNIDISPGNIKTYALFTTVPERFRNLFGNPSETITLDSSNGCISLGPIAPAHTEIDIDDGTISYERQFGLFYSPECYNPNQLNGIIQGVSGFSSGFYKVDWVGVNVIDPFSANSNGVPADTNGFDE